MILPLVTLVLLAGPADAGVEVTLYTFTGRILGSGGELLAGEVDASVSLLKAQDGAPAAVLGAALPWNFPPEATFWLALAEHEWSRHRARIEALRADRVGAGSDESSRQVLHFEPAPEVRCDTLIKRYSEAYARPAKADPVKRHIDREIRARGKMPSSLPGPPVMPTTGQLRFSQAQRDARYVLELHLALDHLDRGEGARSDTTLRCEAPRPILAREMQRYTHRSWQRPDGQRVMLVRPR